MLQNYFAMKAISEVNPRMNLKSMQTFDKLNLDKQLKMNHSHKDSPKLPIPACFLIKRRPTHRILLLCNAEFNKYKAIMWMENVRETNTICKSKFAKNGPIRLSLLKLFLGKAISPDVLNSRCNIFSIQYIMQQQDWFGDFVCIIFPTKWFRFMRRHCKNAALL